LQEFQQNELQGVPASSRENFGKKGKSVVIERFEEREVPVFDEPLFKEW